MLSNDVIATSRYYLNQLQHILSDLRNFDSFGFLAILFLGMKPHGAFVWNWFWIFSLINIIIVNFDDHN